MTSLQKMLQEVDQGLPRATDKLLDLISIPSVSAEPKGSKGIARAAEWLRRELSELGLETTIAETTGHPIVLGTTLASNDRPKLLFYGHYDVQPAEPLDQWTHPPFAPRVVEEDGLHRIYGRGASDSKGQLWSVIEALRAWKNVHQSLPPGIVVLLEGEEEAGSPGLQGFIAANRALLRCDVAFISDSDMWSRDQPAITTRLKGLVHEKVTIHAPNDDLHSGHFGAVAANPIRSLAAILAELHDASGRVAIDGFYDDVADLPPHIRSQWQALDNAPELDGSINLQGGLPEQGFSHLEAIWGRPTADINGISGGNQGPGERSVLPGEAHARLTFRLVANQNPDQVRAAFQRFVRDRLPQGCTASFEGDFGTPAVALSQDNPFLAATARALEAEFSQPAILKGTGGSIPLVEQLSTGLGVECVVTGFILGDDAIHAPNERYDTERLHKGIRSWVRVLAECANIP
ncbi:M20/M25/M40 family metallo-hydrolase [Rhodobacteraceae bacterium D3-12]|nr:M20/M25/M40 family metallo-hydrolase [Rhodobacteraceae bacterium D3-12]